MSTSNRIKVRANGPLLCTGDIEVYDALGTLLKKSDDLVLCRCGHSQHKPFCDGSHRAAGFEDDGQFDDRKPEPPAGEGALKITVRPKAMLVVEGPVSLACADDQVGGTRNKVALCRCGHSGNKPFCDLSHKAQDFEG